MRDLVQTFRRWRAHPGTTTVSILTLVLGIGANVAIFTVVHGVVLRPGVQPALGRAFTAEEERVGRERVVLLGHGFWETRFEADPGVVGRSLVLDDASYTVVGVMPDGQRVSSAWVSPSEWPLRSC